MSSRDIREQAERDVMSVLPERARDLARLRALAEAGDAPVVTVVGKYNHGKSRLLNELAGSDAFAVADRRETVALAEHARQGVRWLDAPGLDADVGSEDDRLALQAAWLRSDIRLVVHAAREGELDAGERALWHALHADEERTRRQNLFVLTQVDQFADDAELEMVMAAIRAQAPAVALHPVSSTRHRKGMDGAKRLLVENSGIPALKAALGRALARVPQAREHEAALLLGEVLAELRQLRSACAGRLEALRGEQARQRAAFDAGLARTLDKVRDDIRAVLDVPGPDHSLLPDAPDDRFRLTAGKRERARLQVAYSRACIHINGFLAGHGVIELPPAQQTAARSLNSILVAVLGVSVKYREDLRRIFCSDAGRETLRRQFAHYYELSADRRALAGRIADVEAKAADAGKAIAALQALETAA